MRLVWRNMWSIVSSRGARRSQSDSSPFRRWYLRFDIRYSVLGIGVLDFKFQVSGFKPDPLRSVGGTCFAFRDSGIGF